MKVGGFTIIRNAVKFDYPVREAILSVLPLCDEMVVAVGDSEDETLELIQSIADPKIRIINTTWDMSLRKGGTLLAVETNKAFDALSPCDWAVYIQADEVLHENSLDKVHNAMTRYKDQPEVEGLLFDYTHFYGSYKYIGDARRWYRHEVRVVRNDKQIRSWGDAMGFRKNNRKLQVKPCDGIIHHYGWVKPPEAQQAKQESFHKMWHDDNWVEKNVKQQIEFDYSEVDSLELFEGTHPKVMKDRIEREDWELNVDPNKKKFGLKDRLLYWIEKKTGKRIGEYRNYKII